MTDIFPYQGYILPADQADAVKIPDVIHQVRKDMFVKDKMYGFETAVRLEGIHEHLPHPSGYERPVEGLGPPARIMVGFLEQEKTGQVFILQVHLLGKHIG